MPTKVKPKKAILEYEALHAKTHKQISEICVVEFNEEIFIYFFTFDLESKSNSLAGSCLIYGKQ